MILTHLPEFRAHILKHHGLEAHAKYVEAVHDKNCKYVPEPGVCEACGKSVENRRVHLIAWHPEISAPKMFEEVLGKPIRKLSDKPRWAERLNKRRKVLVREGKLPAPSHEGDDADISRQPAKQADGSRLCSIWLWSL